MNSKMSRRNFISSLAGASALATLSGCSALDRVFMGQTGDLSDRVVILGGGMAGLMAAFELRKRAIPYRIFEASRRVGGRAWTLQGLTSSGQGGELGCEWFSSEFPLMWDLARELKLEIVEVPEQQKNLLMAWKSSALTEVPIKDLRQLQELARKKAALVADRATLSKMQAPFLEQQQNNQTNLLDWGRELSGEGTWEELLNTWSNLHYGVDASSLHQGVFLKSFLFSESPLEPWAGSRFRFRGGAQSLSQALVDRVIGAIPDDRIRLGHELIDIEKLEDGTSLLFETPEGRRRVRCKYVICALPLAVMRNVEGFSSLSSIRQTESLELAEQAKGLVVFKERFWKKRWSQGRQIGTIIQWESTYKIHDLLESQQGLLSRLWSGRAVRSLSSQDLQRWATELLAKEAKPLSTIADSALKNWTDHRWAKARGSFVDPQRKIWSFVSGDRDWVWAGEHAARWTAGTWGGALESGVRAALELTQGRQLWPTQNSFL